MAARRLIVLARGVRVHAAEPGQAAAHLADLLIQRVGNALQDRQLLHKRIPRQRRLVGQVVALLELHQPQVLLDLAAQLVQAIFAALQVELCGAQGALLAPQMLLERALLPSPAPPGRPRRPPTPPRAAGSRSAAPQSHGSVPVPHAPGCQPAPPTRRARHPGRNPTRRGRRAAPSPPAGCGPRCPAAPAGCAGVPAPRRRRNAGWPAPAGAHRR